jgi:hypothetical protein
MTDHACEQIEPQSFHRHREITTELSSRDQFLPQLG